MTTSVTLRSAGAHQRERLVTRRVEEDDVLVALFADRHEIGADVLSNATGLALGHSRRANRVEQRRLAVIDVAHDRHDRRTHDLILDVDCLRLDLEQFLFEAASLRRRRRTVARSRAPCRCRSSS